MPVFTRDDGKVVGVVEGYRQRVLSDRPRYASRPGWTDEQYAAAADRKLRTTRKFLKEFAGRGGRIAGARVLDMGCGDGINCLLLALEPVESVVGIDVELPLLESVERTERTRRLASEVCKRVGLEGEVDEVLERLPVRLLKMDATAMELADDSFDVAMSRSAIEHIRPVEKAFAEVARVVRQGGLIYLSTDPYFSPRGCHKTGVVDIPWAHARLSPEEYRRFVTEREGRDWALKRCRRLETLNPYTIRRWREIIEAGPFEVLEWNEKRSPLAEELLADHPEVVETVLKGVEHRDLVHGRLKIWLRRQTRR
jgi:SAM-dependent methyltransferase